MKMLRLLIPVVLMLVAVPSYAICGYCDFTCNCVWEPGSGTNCRYGIDCCYERPSTCFDGSSGETPALADAYSIAAVDIVAPASAEQIRVATNDAPAPQHSAPIAP